MSLAKTTLFKHFARFMGMRMMYQHGEQGGTLVHLSFFNNKDTNVTHPHFYKVCFQPICERLKGTMCADSQSGKSGKENKKRIETKKRERKPTPLKRYVFT